jgi:hypothetical protein
MAAGPTLAPGAAFGLYALPSDDLAGDALSVETSGGTGSPPTGNGDEDPEYLGTNLIAPSLTGHLNLPSRPAKLTTYTGYWELVFASPISVSAVHIVYPNFDAGLDVTLEPDGGTPISITIPSRWENGWWPSPWASFDAQSSDRWRLSINGTNSLPLQVGRLMLYGSGGFRDLENDVRWGVEEVEEQGQIEHRTEAQVELLYELFGPRRSFSGEFALDNTKANTLIDLHRNARNRILPWTLIPDEDINDAWFVRFQENRWSRTREMVEHNIFPFRVQELSRGLPWP